MALDVGMLCRIQFALTAGFHFLFPPLTIGLAWLLVLVEWRAWRKGDAVAESAGRFYAKLLGLTFAVGVATGIPMEFQFGTNWSRYSRYVGDIFGAPLAAEGVLAFFLESGFLGLYLFGRNKISRKWHWFAIFMVAVGSTMSAFWILAANSWMQTPAGSHLANGRAELTSLYAAIFNPSTLPRVFHTICASLVAGAFFMAGVAAPIVLRDKNNPVARYSLRLAVIFGLIASVAVVFPSGHIHAREVARYQEEKFAAIEGLYSSQDQAPMVMFAIPFTQPPALKARLEVPGMLSWLAFGDFHKKIKGINEFPANDIPPLWLTFVSFHNMVVLGMYFIAAMAWAVYKLRRGQLFEGRKFLWLLAFSIPLPLAACELGWMAAEAGRQPWAIYKILRTADAFSSNLSAPVVFASILLFSVIYLVLLALYLYLLIRKIQKGPDSVEPSGPLARKEGVLV